MREERGDDLLFTPRLSLFARSPLTRRSSLFVSPHSSPCRFSLRLPVVIPVVIEFDVRLGLQRDEERKGEVAVRRLREPEHCPPVVQVARERDRLRAELVQLEVVVR